VDGRLPAEMVRRFAERDAGARRESGDDARRELGMRADAGTHRGSPEWQFGEHLHRTLREGARPLHLPGETEELLTQAYRCGVLQVGAARLDHRPELVRLGTKRALERVERGDQVARDG